jgi:hypothetical protein
VKAAWEWVKKHWELVVGALILVLGFFLGVQVARRRPAPVLPPNPTKEKAEEEAAAEVHKAEVKAADEKAEVEKAHEAAREEAVENITEKTEEVRDNVDETNTYLKSVGKAVRGLDE